MTTKSIWIEIDSLHSTILLRALKQGLLPNIARVVERGSRAKVNYEVPTQVAAWATAHTGNSVALHGALAYDQRIPGTYRMRIKTRPIQPGTTYWEFLGRMGKRVLVINSVNATPTPEINGIQINDWSVHVAGRHIKPTSFPPDIVASLQRKFPRDLFAQADCGSDEFVDAERLVNAISANLSRKSVAFSELIDREAWDHVHIGIDDLHNFAHVAWEAFEEDSPRSALLQKALSQMDAAVGAFVDRAGSHATVMLLVLAGVGPANTWSHTVDKIIARFESGNPAKAHDRSVYGRLGRVWSMQPPWLTARLLRLKSYLRELYLSSVRRRRLAFAMPLNEESGAIRINLRGREPNGLVAPGADYEALLVALRDAFLELRDIESGLPLVNRVFFTRELLPESSGSAMLPDLFIEWNRATWMRAVQSERLGRIESDFFPARTGDHHVDGLLLMNCPIAREGSVSVLDLAPTVAALHGVKAPQQWRGAAFLEVTRPTLDDAAAA